MFDIGPWDVRGILVLTVLIVEGIKEWNDLFSRLSVFIRVGAFATW